MEDDRAGGKGADPALANSPVWGPGPSMGTAPTAYSTGAGDEVGRWPGGEVDGAGPARTDPLERGVRLGLAALLVGSSVAYVVGVCAVPYFGHFPTGSGNEGPSRAIQMVRDWRQYVRLFEPTVVFLVAAAALLRDRWWRTIGLATVVSSVWWAWPMVEVLWAGAPVGPGMVLVSPAGFVIPVLAIGIVWLHARRRERAPAESDWFEAPLALIGVGLLVLGWFRPVIESRVHFYGGPTTWLPGPALLRWPAPADRYLALRVAPYVVPGLAALMVAAALVLPAAWRPTRAQRVQLWAGVGAALVLQQVVRLAWAASYSKALGESSRIDARVTGYGVVLLLGSAAAFVAAGWAAANPGLVLAPIIDGSGPAGSGSGGGAAEPSGGGVEQPGQEQPDRT